jgi:SAM-dependent methyltransferase
VFGKIKTAIRTAKEFGWHGIVHKLRTRYHLPIPQSAKSTWKAGIAEELAWWDEALASGRLADQLDPNRPLQERIAALLPPDDCRTVTILDVGSGPLTWIGPACPGRTIKIVAVDALSDEYAKLLAKHSVTPLVQSRRLEAEKLAECFAPGTFDLVFARNCMDHSYNPEQAILQMVDVVKPGCFVLLEHHPDEGERVGYVGLHQWNFAMNEEGEFIIKSRNGQVNMSRKYAQMCRITCEVIEDDYKWLITRILKQQQTVGD